MPESAAPEATYVACLTPPGTAAIATLAVRGPDAWMLMRDLFQPLRAPTLPEQPALDRVWLGRAGEGACSDEVVLAVKQMQPVPWLELHCHGGREVVRLLQETLAARGARACSWMEFEELTNHSGSTLALEALTRAPTTRTAAILLDQYHGAFERAVRNIVQALEDRDTVGAGSGIEALLQHAPLGRHLTEPWRVVIAGPPNVGKSSLVNALAGYQRSIVDAQPGTTRDVVTTRLAVDGWPIEIADTAGWHHAAEALEREGIALARQAAQEADVCIWLLDASAPPVWPPEIRMRCVINKIDLAPAWDLQQLPTAPRVSARTNMGIGELCQALSQWLVPEPPPAGAAVPFAPELCDQIAAARDCLNKNDAGAAAYIVRSLCE